MKSHTVTLAAFSCLLITQAAQAQNTTLAATTTVSNTNSQVNTSTAPAPADPSEVVFSELKDLKNQHKNDKAVSLSELNDLNIGLEITDNTLGLTGFTYCPKEYLSFSASAKPSSMSEADASDASDFKNIKTRESVTVTFSPPDGLMDAGVNTLKQCDEKYAQLADKRKNEKSTKPEIKKQDLSELKKINLPSSTSIYANFSESPADTVLAKNELYSKYQNFGNCSECYTQYVTNNHSILVKAYDELQGKLQKEKEKADEENKKKSASAVEDLNTECDKIVTAFSDTNKMNLSPEDFKNYEKKLTTLAKKATSNKDLSEDDKKAFINSVADAYETLSLKVDLVSSTKEMLKNASKYVKVKSDLYKEKAKLPGLDKDSIAEAEDLAKDYAKGGKEHLRYIAARDIHNDEIKNIASRDYVAEQTYQALNCAGTSPASANGNAKSLNVTQCVKLKKEMKNDEEQLALINPDASDDSLFGSVSGQASFADQYLHDLYQSQHPVAPAPVVSAPNPKQTAANLSTKTQINGLKVAIPTQYNPPYQPNPFDLWKADGVSSTNNNVGPYTQTVSNT